MVGIGEKVPVKPMSLLSKEGTDLKAVSEDFYLKAEARIWP